MSDPTRYRAVLSYVGTHFHGWQAQTNAPRTVQQVVEKALGRFSGYPVRTCAAGRTDAGVHADGQVIHFDLPRRREPDRVRDAANALLPWDAKLLSVELAAASFHARRDAASKQYLYRWSRAAVIPPRDSAFVAPISRAADPVPMRTAASLLPGTRDFRVFAVRVSPQESSVRTLFSVEIEERGEEIHGVFRGEGYLRGMVRSLCGVLASVGRRRVPPERVLELLETGDRRLLAPKAAARGLTLVRVDY